MNQLASLILAGLMAILNAGWRRTLTKCMHVATKVKGRRCWRLFWRGWQKIMWELKDRFRNIKS